MNCSNPGCGKSWSTGQQFPLCITHPCPLRAHRNRQLPGRFRWKPRTSFHHKRAETGVSISKIQVGLGRRLAYHPYSMKGAQAARTTVKLPDGTRKFFITRANMHSEMRAIQYMLNQGYWRLYLGMIIRADWNPIKDSHFQTSEPHCGFCTVMLEVLGLPHSRITKGNYKKACNFNYPLPQQIREDPYVLARLLDNNTYCGFDRIKRVLNSFVSTPKEKWVLSINNLAFVDANSYVDEDESDWFTLDWSEVVQQRGVLDAIWRVIFESMYHENKKK